MVLLRIACVVSTELRELNLKRFYDRKIIKKIGLDKHKISHGDWFLMAQLMKNMNVVMNNEFLKLLGNEIVNNQIE